MPRNRSAIIRYRVIDQCLRNSMHAYPTKEYLRDKCEQVLYGEITGDRVSISAIEKDLTAMRNDAALKFFAPIAYHKVKGGYYYSEPDYSIDKVPLTPQEEDAIRFASATLYQYRNISIFEHFHEAIDKIYTRLNLSQSPSDPHIERFVQFERATSSEGRQWLQPLFHAISNANPVSFDYNNVYKQQQKHFVLQPYLLKENRRRWYLLGWYEKHNIYLTFALDRITDLELHQALFQRRNDFEPDAIFQNSTGIMGQGSGELINLQVQVTGSLSRLLELEPLHESQVVENQVPNGLQVSMQVLDTPELMRQLLWYGRHLKVLEPAALRDRLLQEAQALLDNHNA